MLSGYYPCDAETEMAWVGMIAEAGENGRLALIQMAAPNGQHKHGAYISSRAYRGLERQIEVHNHA